MSRELAQPPADDAEPTDPNRDTDAASKGAAAYEPTDRLWHSPAAGLPAPVGSRGGTGPAAGETGAPSKPGSGTYRLLAADESGRYGPVDEDKSRPSADGSATLPRTGAASAGRPRSEDTAALTAPGTGGGGRAREGQTVALTRPGTSREPRSAVGGTAALTRPAIGGTAGAMAGDAAGPTRPAPLIGDSAGLRANWRRVQAGFVDDPRAAVSDAADLVEHAAQALVDALRQRQKQLRDLWDGPLAGDAGAPRDSGWPVAGRLPGLRSRRARGAGDTYRAPDGAGSLGAATATPADGKPDAGASDGPAAAVAVTDVTEHLRLVMLRYRTLFDQICRP